MIRSMTGYGKASQIFALKEYQVEIRSVNHRYSDISIKMPRVLSYLEEEVKKEISSKIKRGKIDVLITFYNGDIDDKEIKINTEIAKVYIEELKKLAEQEGILSNIEVTEISKLPDVLNIKSKQDDETIKEELLEVVNKAINNLSEMRKQEGKKIAEDLLKRVNTIKEKTEKIIKQRFQKE